MKPAIDDAKQPTAAANIVGIAAMLCARLSFGMGWVPSALIFLPVRAS